VRVARPRQVSDEDILQAAQEVFLEVGPHASVQLVADKVGLSQAALFKRFQTKEELLFAALAPPTQPPFTARLLRGPDSDPVGDQLYALGQEMLTFFRAILPRMAALRSAGVCPDQIMRRYPVPPPVVAIQALAGWFDAARQRRLLHTDDPLVLAVTFLGALQGRAFGEHLYGAHLGPLEDQRFLRGVVSTLLHGIAPRESR
jgi:AcrR family transcriptional regulator